jgi:hypothetical protein
LQTGQRIQNSKRTQAPWPFAGDRRT